MPSSSRTLACIGAVVGACAFALPARAQQPAKSFVVERLYQSAPGGGWFVMDDLNIHGGLGGAMQLSLGYSGNPFVVGDAANRIHVVENQAFVGFGAAITYVRWRFYLSFDSPLAIDGESGVVGDYSFTGPSVSFGANPDAVSDVRFGTDLRILGMPGSVFRLGAGAQLFIPTSNAGDYNSDGDFRGMLRVLAAGDIRYFTYAAQLGVHIRPLDEYPTPGGPRGSELLFGVAGGAKLPVGHRGNWVAVVGPEIYGATAFKAFFGGSTTAVEGLLSGRLEGTRDNKAQLRVKLGVGAGLNDQFGAPEWRIVVGVEMFGQHTRTPAPSANPCAGQ